jgi:two-component system sensor histidine kinase DegS
VKKTGDRPAARSKTRTASAPPAPPEPELLPTGGASGVEQSLIYARDLRRVFADLERKEEQQKLLLSKLISAQEEERKRIAQDIHDDALQILGFNLMKIDLIERLWEKGEPEQALQHLGELRGTIETAIAKLREVITELRPASLDFQGLLPTLDDYLTRFQQDSGIEAFLNSQLGKRQSPATETLVFRLLQEILVNVRKHSGATKVFVTLETVEGYVHVNVEDNGKGFIVEDAMRRSISRGSIGLHSLIERIELADGAWSIESEPGKGARVTFRVPVDT